MTSDSRLREPDPRDREWFERVFGEHHRAVLAFARRRVPDDADDVVAEVFATAWRRRDAVPDEALPWLYRTASHHILHARRGAARRSRTATALAQELAGGGPVHEPMDQEPVDVVVAGLDTGTALDQALALIPARDREILRLWAWENLAPVQIGDVLGCSTATARVRLHRARRRLKGVLESRRLAPPPPAPGVIGPLHLTSEQT